MKFKIYFILVSVLLTSSCLKTRSELGEQQQSQVYGRKNADNQADAQRESQLATGQAATPAVDERDEMIRNFNGRVENLENQITQLQKEKSEATNASTADSQKIQMLQEALAKMEAQIQKLEAERAAEAQAPKAGGPNHPVVGSDANTVKSSSGSSGSAGAGAKAQPANAYDAAQDHFAKKEWKRAILSYQKYVDENPKGKNVPDSKYKIGVCFQEMGMKDEAMAFYEEVIAQYGKTEAGKKAKIRLTKLKK